MMPWLWLVAAVLFLAYTNGANDNFKGVATLFGSGTTDYRRALGWATLTTLAGSVAAVLFAGQLVQVFSGKGLVPDTLTQDPGFLLAVTCGTALTVLLATLVGFPISTTHALTGALVGAGCAAAGSGVNLHRLGQVFFLPLALSPCLAFAATAAIYPALRWTRLRLGVERAMCLCIDGGEQRVLMQPDGTAVLAGSGMRLSVGELAQCRQRYQGTIIGIDAQWVLDRLHYLSAGTVSFARGLNDTPKIVALLVAAGALQVPLAVSLAVVGLAMALGGGLNARKVAMTMSRRVTAMNHGQGFTANLVTACLVTLASRFGLPVSTTHVSCGSLMGIGLVSRQGRWGTIGSILMAWLITLPLAGLLGATGYWLIRSSC